MLRITQRRTVSCKTSMLSYGAARCPRWNFSASILPSAGQDPEWSSLPNRDGNTASRVFGTLGCAVLYLNEIYLYYSCVRAAAYLRVSPVPGVGPCQPMRARACTYLKPALCKHVQRRSIVSSVIYVDKRKSAQVPFEISSCINIS